jgi:hypothetical protein
MAGYIVSWTDSDKNRQDGAALHVNGVRTRIAQPGGTQRHEQRLLMSQKPSHNYGLADAADVYDGTCRVPCVRNHQTRRMYWFIEDRPI